MNKSKTFLLSLTFLFLFSCSSIVLAGASPEPYTPDKTFETIYELDGGISVKTIRPKVEYQYDIGCFEYEEGQTIYYKESKSGSNKKGYPFYIPDLTRMCSVSNFGSKSEIEITKNGKTIIVGENEKITEGEDIGTYNSDYIELYDRRKTIGFLVAESKVVGNCFPNCKPAYLINPDTLEVFEIRSYLNIVDLKDAFAVCSGGELFLDCEARYCNLHFFYETYFDKMSKKKIKTFKTIKSCVEGVQGLRQKQNTVGYFEKERIKIMTNGEKEGMDYPPEQPLLFLGKVDVEKKFWNDGKVKYKKVFKNKKSIIQYTWWYQNGNKEGEVSYKNGIREGTWTWWNKKGHKLWEKHYKDGNKNGTWIWWNQKGNKVQQMGYKDGNKNGTWIWWNQKGNKVQQMGYKDGKRHGYETHWDDLGEKILEKDCYNGRCVNLR